MGKLTEITAGVDWLTMTMPAEDGRGKQWASEVSRMWDILEGGCGIRHTRNLNGYAGVICSSLFVGESLQGYIVQSSGASTNDIFKAGYEPYANTTRLDLQVTLRGTKHVGLADARAQYDALGRWPWPYAGQSPGGRFIENRSGGWTIYIGSNTSDQTGRIYDKFLEQKHAPEFENCIRYEVQLRNRNAAAGARSIYRHGEELQACEVENFVRRWYGFRGVQVPFEIAEIQAVVEPARPSKSDVATRLKWLETQVKPTIAYLGKHVPMDEILDALGIHALASFADSPNLIIDRTGTPRKWSKR